MVHPGSATIPAVAACAAAKQGKFEQFEAGIWEKLYPKMREGGYSQEKLDGLAKELGLNMDQYQKDVKGDCPRLVKKDQAELQKVGVSGTPAFYINGRFLSGARPIDQFKTLIDEEMKKADKAISGGTPVDKYYATHVLGKGLKGLQAEKGK